MSKEISVILVRANWCGHCKNFEPIFDETKKNYLENDFFKNYKMKFVDYDMESSEGKIAFENSHGDAQNLVNGYPTIIVKISDSDKKEKYHTIDHTVVDNSVEKKNQHQHASKKFLNKLIDLIKTVNSDQKITYTDEGGFNNKYRTSLTEINFRNKYLKYKSKYLKLKKI
jgi:thiol-disulfide isomerase/thioredoxin